MTPSNPFPCAGCGAPARLDMKVVRGAASTNVQSCERDVDRLAARFMEQGARRISVTRRRGF